MRPRIGITTSFEQLQDGAGEQRLRLEYVTAVTEAGGLPLIIPMIDEDDAIDELSHLLDGLIVTGGPAVTEGLEGALPDDLSANCDTRLNADLALIRRMLSMKKPYLGICYGMQQLNALAGGTIYADVENVGRLNEAHIPEDTLPPQVNGLSPVLSHSQKRGGVTHPIHIRKNTHLHNVLQQETVEVNTRHLQAVATVGDGLRVSAVAPDGVIEAIEDETGLCIGVQFHPERSLAQFKPLFTHLIDRSRRDPVPASPV